MTAVRADCVGDLEPCQEVTIDVSACEFVSIDNKKEIEQYGATGLRVETVRGLRLTASALITYPSSCSLTWGSPHSASQQPNEFFYKTDQASGCSRFMGKTKAFWLVPRRCDTAPRTGRCLPNEVVLVDESPRYSPVFQDW
jgi:hypothetical protein